MKKINLSKFIEKNQSSFLHEENGSKIRMELNLDEIDISKDSVEVIIPKSIITMTPKFFLGLFGKSLNILGEEKFFEKYRFMDTRDIIQKQIKSSIDDWKFSNNTEKLNNIIRRFIPELMNETFSSVQPINLPKRTWINPFYFKPIQRRIIKKINLQLKPLNLHVEFINFKNKYIISLIKDAVQLKTELKKDNDKVLEVIKILKQFNMSGKIQIGEVRNIIYGVTYYQYILFSYKTPFNILKIRKPWCSGNIFTLRGKY